MPKCADCPAWLERGEAGRPTCYGDAYWGGSSFGTRIKRHGKDYALMRRWTDEKGFRCPWPKRVDEHLSRKAQRSQWGA